MSTGECLRWEAFDFKESLPRYRFIYVDELENNQHFREQNFYFMQMYQVDEKTALVNGYISGSYKAEHTKYY